MLYFFILSIIVGLAFSYSSIRNITYILKASPLDDNSFSSEVPKKLLGTVEQDTIKSPLTQTVCAFWQIQVRVNARRSIRKIFEITSDAPFIISSGGEKIYVYPEWADLLLHDFNAKKWQNGFMGTPFRYKIMDSKIMNTVREMGAEFNEFNEHSGVVVIENHLVAGDDVFVTGNIDFKDGSKAMRGNNNLLILSNWNEKEYLWRQVGWIAIRLFAAAMIGYIIFRWLFK